MLARDTIEGLEMWRKAEIVRLHAEQAAKVEAEEEDREELEEE